MSRLLEETSQFKRDKKRIKRSGRHDPERLREVVSLSMNDRTVQARHRDLELSGDYAGVRECHVEPDWLLVYDKVGSIAGGTLKLIRTGSHSELF